MENLKLICGKGAEDLTSDEKLILNKLTNEYYEKMKRHIGDIDLLEVHLKCHKKEGNTKRYAIETKFSLGKYRFETSSDEWDLEESIHKAMKKLESEIEHKIARVKEDKSWKKKARV